MRTYLLFLLVVCAAAACPAGKSAACASCGGSLSASSCVCACALSRPESLAYALVAFPALAIFLLYV